MFTLIALGNSYDLVSYQADSVVNVLVNASQFRPHPDWTSLQGGLGNPEKQAQQISTGQALRKTFQKEWAYCLSYPVYDTAKIAEDPGGILYESTNLQCPLPPHHHPMECQGQCLSEL